MILTPERTPDWAVQDLKTFDHVVIYSKDELPTLIQNSRVLIVRSWIRVTRELIEKARDLRLVVRAGVGLDNVDVESCRAFGVQVVNTPNAPKRSVAEHALALIFACAKNLWKHNAGIRKGAWMKKERSLELNGKTLGIVGLGRTGTELAKLASSLGMKVVYYSRRKKKVDWPFMELNDLLKISDFVSLHVPLTNETRGMIGERELRMMKKTAFLINTARGPVVDEEALYKALKEGWIAGAAFDVFWEEPYKGKLLELPNFYCTCHVASNTDDAQRRIWKEVVKIVGEFYASEA